MGGEKFAVLMYGPIVKICFSDWIEKFNLVNKKEWVKNFLLNEKKYYKEPYYIDDKE